MLHPTRTGYIHSKNAETPSKISPIILRCITLVLIYTKKRFVLVKDRTRRASVHLLLLPWDKSRYELHHLTAYSDPLFRAQVQSEINVAKKVVARRLAKLHREAASTSRDWEAEIRTGFHVAPSTSTPLIRIILMDFCNNTSKLWQRVPGHGDGVLHCDT